MIIICDKSTIQSLNGDQAFWLGIHYRANVVPIFLTEVLADLHKPPPEGRTAVDVVAKISKKVPQLGAFPNVYHGTLVLGDLLGHPVEMLRVPVIPEGKIIQAGGRVASYYGEMPESAAVRRWRKGDFLGVERDYAKAWREALEKLDLTSIRKASQARGTLKLSDLAAAKAAADDIALANGRRYAVFKAALDALNIPESYRPAILRRWKEQGGPALRDFAPYADYVFRCEVFFHLAIATGKIDAVRTSNRNDMAYLFYLPFCRVFTSFDRLHASIAPLFMGEDQTFVPGQQLKDDLAKLNAYYLALPEEVRATGAMQYAAYPPLEGDYLTSRLYDQFEPGWREHARNPIKLTPEINKKVMEHLGPVLDAIERGEGAPQGATRIETKDDVFTFTVDPKSDPKKKP
ncbi:hypothetical protein ABID58_006352 [Bradyrhizobium sp. S3.2.6]|uniref:hypothetical protein n=1 Tax=Bradyrhizobium sp. S3.2.6 TaxID=3156428 RepID=UPI003394FC0C